MITTRNILSKQNLLDRASSYQIFSAYCLNFEQVGKSFKSEFRDEKSPSCMIEMVGGDLLYTDFGEGSYYAIAFVMRKFNISFWDTVKKINADLNLGLIDMGEKVIPMPVNNHIIKTVNPSFREKTTTGIEVRYAPYKDEDLEYWAQYGWTEEMLQKASIRPIDYYWLTMEHKGIDRMPFAVPHELAYTYDYYRNRGIYRRKLYFPLREAKYKWVSNVDNTIIQNWDLLPKEGGDLLFITSSKKDCGPYFRIYNKWIACSPNNEQGFISEKVFYAKLRPRWKRIVIHLDNDYTGITNALKWAKKYQLEAVWNPLRCPHKDQSDLWKADGGREFNYQLQKLIS